MNDAESERLHNLQGENTRTDLFNNRAWRTAFDGGWFSYTMQVAPTQPMALHLSTWGGDGPGHDFDIFIDGIKLVSVLPHVIFGGKGFHGTAKSALRSEGAGGSIPKTLE